MRIVNIILTSQNGGAEQVFLDYLKTLKDLNHQVLAITKEDAPYANQVLEMGAELKKIKNNFGDFDIFAAKNIANILKEFKADAVVAHVGRAMVLSRKAIGKNKDIKLIAVNHSTNVKRSIGSDIILSVNKEIFYRTIQKGQSEDRSFVISNAIDLSDAIEVAPEVDLQNKNEIVIGVMGRFQKCKGFSEMLYVLKNLETISNKKFFLKIAGGGQEESNLKDLVKKLNLQDRVEFCGWIKNKNDFFFSIDIFCMPSIDSSGETFGLVILEAVKYRKPVIVTDCDGPKEVVRDRVDGLIVQLQPENLFIERFSRAIIDLSNNNILTNQIIQNSFIRLKEKFSYAALKNRLKEIFGEN